MDDFAGFSLSLMTLACAFLMFTMSIVILADISGCRPRPAATAEAD
jgi:hypothetical protein